MNYTKEQIDDFLRGVYSGEYDASDNLPKDLYKAIAGELIDGLSSGIGGMSYGNRSVEVAQSLRENVYMFSGAKTYQQVREMGTLVADTNGFADFKSKALDIYETYNTNWLRSEYNTAYGQGVIANQWSQIEADKELFPYLRYSAVMDPNTSEECQSFHGTVLRVDDPFWDAFTPLNHFNCRCILEQIDRYSDVKLMPESEKAALMTGGKEGVDATFQMNPFKDGYVFSPEHPYFQVATKDVAFAQTNFDLPIPKRDFNFVPAEMDKDEIEKAMKTMFAQNGNMTMKVSTEGLSLDVARTRLDCLQNLMNDYRLIGGPEDITRVKLSFESDSGTFGYVKRYTHNASFAEINFGNRVDSVSNRIFVNGGTSLRFKSAIDEVNHALSTQVHEFAHVISVEQRRKVEFYGKETKAFWKEMSTLQKDYLAELKLLNNAGNETALYNIHIGRYAETNLNEFMAEGFTEYRLKTNPSKYAEKIGKTIDKYFKK